MPDLSTCLAKPYTLPSALVLELVPYLGVLTQTAPFVRAVLGYVSGIRSNDRDLGFCRCHRCDVRNGTAGKWQDRSCAAKSAPSSVGSVD